MTSPADTAARLRELADAMSETHMYYDLGGEEDGIGLTLEAQILLMNFRDKTPDFLRWAADVDEWVQRVNETRLQFDSSNLPRDADALLSRLAQLTGQEPT